MTYWTPPSAACDGCKPKVSGTKPGWVARMAGSGCVLPPGSASIMDRVTTETLAPLAAGAETRSPRTLTSTGALGATGRAAGVRAVGAAGAAGATGGGICGAGGGGGG